MSEFKNGDVVKLKSGGQAMTISQVIIGYKTKQPNGLVICQWFDGTLLKEAEFNVDSLVKA